MTFLLVLLSCGRPPEVIPPAVVSPVASLPGPRLLRRISLDLRRVLPTVVELDAVEEDAGNLLSERDAFLQDPRLAERLVSMYAETFQTRMDLFEVTSISYRIPDDQNFAYVKSVGEEPLRLLAYVAQQDLPWTDTVTADYTVANEMLAEVWRLDYPEGATGWQASRYVDGRPAAGVLATNGLWWRYVTNRSNLNRSRAAAMSKLLLCHDYLDRPVSFTSASTSLSDEEGIALAIRTEPACIGCHVSLDPLASAMFGFYTVMAYNSDELDQYHPEREPEGESELGVAPSYFGTPIGGLADLGQQVAADPRFVTCATKTMAEQLWHRESTNEDFDRLESLRIAFEGSGLHMRALVRAVTDSDVYRAGSLTDTATEEEVSHEMTVRMLSPDQLQTVIEDLTGFRWTMDTYDVLADDSTGYRVLAGGVDGDTVGSPQRDPGLTWALVSKRLAEGAAGHAVEAELVNGGERRLFTHVTLDTVPGDPDFTAELEDLHWRLFGIRADTDALAADEALWTAIAEQGGPAEAWKGLSSALLRLPDFLGY